MTGSVAAVDGAAAAPVSPAATDRTPPERRGRTSVADAVIEKMAGHAAGEVDLVSGVGSRVLGVGWGGRRSRPAVTARIDGKLARLTVSIGVDYPAPLRQVSAAVRTRVTETVGRLAAIDVREVDVEVVGLVRDAPPRGRVR